MINNISEIGFLRLPKILQLIPISKSSWWEGVKNGKFPKPVKLGIRTTAWKSEDIKNLIERLSKNDGYLNGGPDDKQ
ncbi:helix-turn-helix transcriptional regulator [Pseudomonadota bacterium]